MSWLFTQTEDAMKFGLLTSVALAAALALPVAANAQGGAAAGATTGAVTGAIVGGPVGAAVDAGVGAVAGGIADDTRPRRDLQRKNSYWQHYPARHHSSSELLGRPSMKKAAAIWYSDLGVRKLIEGALRTAGLMKLDNQCIDCKSAHTIAAARHI
jgi:Na+/glutamate symporter